ncbi:MAG TPA: acyl-[ACP]--phospholipid O-acyltransferase [Vicinamibacterales bacterium]|jgi:acyl-[acyl-carrier-protein]-phospholipid O-acyltransferase/long-chain-fatty-acid--[acyl-carrier-protein] ligase|nr:acyl-[ACP]--phospholipid O-acyltransferase [Vicinamibacterales bacterium]
MRSPLVQLLTARRFAPLFVTQFLGAFNDNLLKSAMGIAVTFRLAEQTDSASLVMLAGAVFTAPYFLFSGMSGTLADRVDKATIARIVKVVEIGIMALGAVGLWLTNVPTLFVALFCLGTHSTVFGPIKYALLPQHLRDEELVAGNALIEAGTFLAILLGTILGGSVVLVSNGALIVGGLGVVAAMTGWIASRQIPAAPPSAGAERLRPRFLHDTVAVVGYVTSRPALLMPILAASWFWLFGLVVLSGLAPFAKDVLFANEQVVTMMLALFAVGVGIGSIVAERLLHGEVSARYVPIAAMAMAFFAWDLHAASLGRAQGAELATRAVFLAQPGTWRILVDLVGVAMAGGLFTVPLYAILQHESEPEHRARVIAANNIINAVAMAAGTVGSAALLKTGMTTGELFGWCGLATIPVALVAAWILRRSLAKSLVRLILKVLYRVKVEGLEHARAAMPHAVIAANHASFLDGLLLGAFLPGDPIFAVDTLIAKQWWARPFLMFVNALPVDPTNPLSIRSMIRAVEAGSACIIFPEGRITTTGSLMKVYEGPAVIAERTKAALLPIRIDGVEFTPFSRLAGKVRRRWFPRIQIRILPPRMLTAPEGVTGRARRVALRRALGDQMVQSMFAAAHIDTTLFDALLAAREQHGGSHVIADDLEMRPLSYRGLVTASFALGGALARRTREGERVGLLLPTSRASLVTFFALQAHRRVPAMLNFSTGPASAIAACRGAEIALIVTARVFIEKAKLQPLVAALEPHATILYLEDIKPEIGLMAKLSALVRSLAAKPDVSGARANEPGVVLFTSGSEGTPKGVVLSHRNLLANRHQIASVIDMSPKDIVFNALPVFHSFGLTGGLLLPLLAGVRTFLYPSPLHYRTVPEFVYGVNATILFGTDTFLAGYARVADNYDFYSVRYVFAGAERVKPETRRVWFEKFGIRILEGYGATETSPALSVNTPMHFRAGTVGRLLPGIEHRLERIEGIDAAGRLFVRGPNVMLGYLRAENPGVLQPPADGWYDTGDIVDIDAEGFVTIKGRAKRFAKVAGEMVPLGAVEDFVAKVWPEAMHAVVAVPDPKRGEQLVLVTERGDATRAALATAARESGLPEIFVPRSIIPVPKVPILGTGKIDYVTSGQLATETVKAS